MHEREQKQRARDFLPKKLALMSSKVELGPTLIRLGFVWGCLSIQISSLKFFYLSGFHHVQIKSEFEINSKNNIIIVNLLA